MQTNTVSNISPMTWVRDEIRQSLLRVSEKLENVTEPDQIDLARAFMYQATAALRMAEQEGLAVFSEAIEGAIAVFTKRPDDSDLQRLICTAVNALMQGLGEVLNQVLDTPLRLFPLYCQLLQRQEKGNAEESDLFFPALTVSRPPLDIYSQVSSKTDLLKNERNRYQQGLLQWLRGDNDGLGLMLKVLSEIDRLEGTRTAFWWVATGFVEALQKSGIEIDNSCKILCGRFDIQIRELLEGKPALDETLLRKILFKLARSRLVSTRIGDIQSCYRLQSYLPVTVAVTGDNLADRYSRLSAIRGIISELKESWSHYVDSGPDGLPQFLDLLKQFEQQIENFNNITLLSLLKELRDIAISIPTVSGALPEGFPVEMAIALLLIEDSLELLNVPKAFFDLPVEQVARRLRGALNGEAETIDIPEGYDLAYRISIADGLLQQLREIERVLEQSLRNPGQFIDLSVLSKPLLQTASAFEMLTMPAAAKTVATCQELIAKFGRGEGVGDQQQERLLADLLSSLEFYAQLLRQGKLQQEQQSSEQQVQKDVPEIKPVTSAPVDESEILKDVAVDLGTDTKIDDGVGVNQDQNAEAKIDQGADPEIVEIFTEEALEVLTSIQENLRTLRMAPDDRECLVTIRRGFHTLKGSGRTAGLVHCGDAAWAVERLLNEWLEKQTKVNLTLVEFLGFADRCFSGWIQELQQTQQIMVNSGELVRQAELLRAAKSSTNSTASIIAAKVEAENAGPATASAVAAATPSSLRNLQEQDLRAVPALIANPKDTLNTILDADLALPEDTLLDFIKDLETTYSLNFDTTIDLQDSQPLTTVEPTGSQTAEPVENLLRHTADQHELSSLAADRETATSQSEVGASDFVPGDRHDAPQEGSTVQIADVATPEMLLSILDASLALADDTILDFVHDLGIDQPPPVATSLTTESAIRTPVEAAEKTIQGPKIADAIADDMDGLTTHVLASHESAEDESPLSVTTWLETFDANDEEAQIENIWQELDLLIEPNIVPTRDPQLTALPESVSQEHSPIATATAILPVEPDSVFSDHQDQMKDQTSVPAASQDPEPVKNSVRLMDLENFSDQQPLSSASWLEEKLGLVPEDHSTKIEVSAIVSDDEQETAAMAAGLVELENPHEKPDVLENDLYTVAAIDDGDSNAIIEDQSEPVVFQSENIDIDFGVDTEIVEIFTGEAMEVLQAVQESLQLCMERRDDGEALVIIRRAFHTLKGSGRMAGFTHLGEAAWTVEQVLNEWLEKQHDISLGLLEFIGFVYACFERWITELREHRRITINAGDLKQQAEQLRQEFLLNSSAAPDAVPTEPRQIAETAVTNDYGYTVTTTLYNIFTTESQQHLATFAAEYAALKNGQPVQHECIRAVHTLAGIARTVGITALAELSFALEQWLQFLYEHALLPQPAQFAVLDNAYSTLEAMVQLVGKGQLPTPANALVADLQALLNDTVITVVDKVDDSTLKTDVHGSEFANQFMADQEEIEAELLTVFIEEALELTVSIGNDLRAWRANPDDKTYPEMLARALHTLKGSARTTGVMRLGEIVHVMETQVITAMQAARLDLSVLSELEAKFDSLTAALEYLQKQSGGSVAHPQDNPAAVKSPVSKPEQNVDIVPSPAKKAEVATIATMLRVPADTLERMVNSAAEINISRSRIASEARAAKQILNELNESVIRLRNQLREIEIQAETQMQARLSQISEEHKSFDPLEFDRYTRLQELTRGMAESVHDVATVQQNLLKSIDETDFALSQQSRLNRDIQEELLRIRTVEFNSITYRLQRIVRQAARDVAKTASLEIMGGHVELDRGLLEKIIGPLEHLLRNAIVHGLEKPEVRHSSGKPESGRVAIGLRQEANQIVLTLSDDGAGLNADRIRAKAVELQFISYDAEVTEKELYDLIFRPGFTTAEIVTAVAGRGVGMDVVRSTIVGLGGHVEVASSAGKGTTFTLYLPLTLVVTQAVLVRAGNEQIAIPVNLVNQVQFYKTQEMQDLQGKEQVVWQGHTYPFYNLSQLLGNLPQQTEKKRYHSVMLLASGEQRLALQVDELLRNREIVIKGIGPHLARLPGVVGATIADNGEILLIINPLQLSKQKQLAIPTATRAAVTPAAVQQQTILVVDDSVTMRKFTSRALTRAGYQVVTAKDGIEAIERLQEVTPSIILLDIEMPRMDGFEFTKYVRGNPKTIAIPIIMISSRTADKHREHALQLGVNGFLGKPYLEHELLWNVQVFISPANQYLNLVEAPLQYGT